MLLVSEDRCLIQTLLTSDRLIHPRELRKDACTCPASPACINIAEDPAYWGTADGYLGNLTKTLSSFLCRPGSSQMPGSRNSPRPCLSFSSKPFLLTNKIPVVCTRVLCTKHAREGQLTCGLLTLKLEKILPSGCLLVWRCCYRSRPTSRAPHLQILNDVFLRQLKK